MVLCPCSPEGAFPGPSNRKWYSQFQLKIRKASRRDLRRVSRLHLETHVTNRLLFLLPAIVPSQLWLLPPSLYPVTFGRCTPAVGVERQQERRAGRRQCFTPRSKQRWTGCGSHTSPRVQQIPHQDCTPLKCARCKSVAQSPHLPTSEHQKAACPKNHTCPLH